MGRHRLATVNAKDYVKWLFEMPLLKRMKPINAARSLAVARYLAAAAGKSPNGESLMRLAHQVCLLPLRVSGKVATVDECRQFLSDYGPCLPAPYVDAVQSLLDSSTIGPVEPKATVHETSVEYRPEHPVVGFPMLWNLGRPSRQKWPEDDLTLRICVALDAMESAKCKRGASVVAEALRASGKVPPEYCTVPHVLSRERVFRGRVPEIEQEMPMYLSTYWQKRKLDSSKRKVVARFPTRFAFHQCDC